MGKNLLCRTYFQTNDICLYICPLFYLYWTKIVLFCPVCKYYWTFMMDNSPIFL